jgi:hypothetical protein
MLEVRRCFFFLFSVLKATFNSFIFWEGGTTDITSVVLYYYRRTPDSTLHFQDLQNQEVMPTGT